MVWHRSRRRARGRNAGVLSPASRHARTARERIRIDGGGYRRDHLRALAQRIEVADREVRIIGSKTNLLQTLTAAAGVKSATPGVRSSVLKWRRGGPPYATAFCGRRGDNADCPLTYTMFTLH